MNRLWRRELRMIIWNDFIADEQVIVFQITRFNCREELINQSRLVICSPYFPPSFFTGSRHVDPHRNGCALGYDGVIIFLQCYEIFKLDYFCFVSKEAVWSGPPRVRALRDRPVFPGQTERWWQPGQVCGACKRNRTQGTLNIYC